MKPFRFILFFLLLVLLQSTCRNTVSSEFGELTLQIEWSNMNKAPAKQPAPSSLLKGKASEQHQKSSASNLKSASTKLDTLPDVSMVRITLEPGPLVYEFTEILPSYSIQAELGIYNILIEVIGQNGLVIFTADTSEILIRPPNQVQITLKVIPNYPTSAPEFIGLQPMTTLNIGDYHLSWTQVAKADTFQLEESTNSNFTSPVLIYSGPDTSCDISSKTDGIYYYRVRAKNALGVSPWSAYVGFQLEIAEALKFLTSTIPNGVITTPYQTSICFQGGIQPYDWQIQDNILPVGLTATLSDSCIIISGIPTVVGEYPLIIDIYDSGTPQQSVQFNGSIKITVPTLENLSVTLNNGKVNVEYADCYTLSDNLSGYAWVFSDYPDWLTVDINSEICFTGTPDADGIYTWTAQGYHPDTPQNQTFIIFTLNIEPEIATLKISTSTLESGNEGQAYETSICATGGVTPYSYEIIQGGLPAGLTSDSDECFEISGTPTAAGIYSFIVEVSDNDFPPATAQKAFVIEIEESISPLNITTQTIPDGYLDVFYQQTICCEGGIQPYEWEIQEGSLPPGLALENEENGICVTITGTPETEGEYSFTLKAIDSNVPAATAQKAFVIEIEDATPPLQITTQTVPDGYLETFYEHTLCCDGGMQPYEWEIQEGSLPPGLALENEENGTCVTITGTPETQGEYTFTLQVTDSDDPVASVDQEFTITILPAVLHIITESLTEGTVAVAYNQTVCAENGTLPYQWEITEGSLPEGLNAVEGECLSITGTPAEAGSFPLTIQVTDASTPAQIQTQNYTLEIQPPPLWISTGQIANGTQDSYYVADITAIGGSGDWNWQISSGSLPPGLTFRDRGDHATVSGTPTTAGTYIFNVQVNDNVYTGLNDNKRFTMTIQEAPSFYIVTTALSNTDMGTTSYLDYLCATGGTQPYSWSVISGSMPPIITLGTPLNECIDVSGSPIAIGVYPFTVRVTDSSDPVKTATKAFSITVSPAPLNIYTASPLPDGQAWDEYDETICAQGGSVDYSWSMIGGSLPAGMTFTDWGECAHVTGPAEEDGVFSITVRVTDNIYPELSDTKTFSLTINP